MKPQPYRCELVDPASGKTNEQVGKSLTGEIAIMQIAERLNRDDADHGVESRNGIALNCALRERDLGDGKKISRVEEKNRVVACAIEAETTNILKFYWLCYVIKKIMILLLLFIIISLILGCYIYN